MAITLNDFFKPVPTLEGIEQEDYKKVDPYIHFAKSISQITYQSIYLVDYYKKGFIYVSDNQIFLCGYTPEQVLRYGFVFYLKNVPEIDLEMLIKINKAGFDFFRELPHYDKLKYSISYDFHLKQKNGSSMLVNHKLKPLVLDRHSNPWIALCLVSISSQTKAGNVRFKSNELKKIYELDLIKNEWIEVNTQKLNTREKEILAYSAQGLTMEQIALKLFLSVDTIKFHKKSIFSKLGVKSISEAIGKSIDSALI